jgi:hypothetical protein
MASSSPRGGNRPQRVGRHSSSSRALPETRMVVLRLLHNRSADLRDQVGKIDILVKDLLLNPVFKTEAKSIMADLHKLAE